jgi:PAS domain S-box-containing protein
VQCGLGFPGVGLPWELCLARYAEMDIGSVKSLQQHASDAFLWDLLDVAPEAIIGVDDAQRIVLFNRSAEQMFGYAGHEAINQSLDLLLPERFVEVHRQHMAAFAAAPDATRHIGQWRAVWGRRKDGSEFPAEGSVGKYVQNGRTTFMAILRDISERVQTLQLLEQQVEERTREIERRRQVVEGLRDIVAVLNSNRSLDEILEFVVGQACRLLQAQAVAVYLVQTDGRLHMQTAAGKDTQLPADISFAVGEGSLGQAVSQRQPVTVPDIGAVLANGHEQRADPQQLRCWENVAEHHRALLALPLAVEDQTHGGILLYYPDARQLGSEETQLAIALSDQAALAIQNARLRQQAEQLAVLDERHRLARELHDSVTQSLFSLTLLAEAGRRLAGAGDLQRVQAHLGRLGTTAQQALKEMRLLVYQLRPLELATEGLVGALQQRLDAVERRAGVETRLLVEGVIQLPSSVEEELYRIAMEALNNALKHAIATSVVVRIQVEDGQLELEVTDNGTGFDLDPVGDKGGLGLVGIRERVKRLGGTLTIRSTPGRGTQVQVRVRVGSEVPV